MPHNRRQHPLDSLRQVTPLILTYNEEPNISRTLSCLAWAQRIVVVDSGSTDRTLEILASDPRVDVVQRAFDTHANQWNHGLKQISAGWVLSLDADYWVTHALQSEMAAAVARADHEQEHQSSTALTQAENPVDGFRIPFRYCIFGKPLRGTVLPPRLALFRRAKGSYRDDGHTQDLVLLGRSSLLRQPIFHDDRKPLSRWLWAQQRYVRLEVDKLMVTPADCLGRADRLRRRYIVAPIAVFLLCLVWKRGLLDGWRGWFYAFQRLYVEVLLSLMLWEAQHGR